MPGPQTLIVVKDVRGMSRKNTEIPCFPRDMVSNMTERILYIVAAHLTVKTIIVHIGTNNVVKQQSEVLNQDFIDLLTSAP